MAIRLEHTAMMVSSAYSGHQFVLRELFLAKPNSKNLPDLFNMKRANRHHETSEKSLCIFAFLFIDTQQSTVGEDCLVVVVRIVTWGRLMCPDMHVRHGRESGVVVVTVYGWQMRQWAQAGR